MRKPPVLKLVVSKPADWKPEAPTPFYLKLSLFYLQLSLLDQMIAMGFLVLFAVVTSALLREFWPF